MGLKKQFKTDEKLETEGIVLDYGDTRIRIARAGGANKRYVKLLSRLTKPLRRAIATESLGDEQANDIMRVAFAKEVVLGWETKVGDKWISGVDPQDAGVDGTDLLPANADNYVKVFENLPDLFTDIQQQAAASTLFRAELDEAELGN
jgi:hypothetical protein